MGTSGRATQGSNKQRDQIGQTMDVEASKSVGSHGDANCNHGCQTLDATNRQAWEIEEEREEHSDCKFCGIPDSNVGDGLAERKMAAMEGNKVHNSNVENSFMNHTQGGYVDLCTAKKEKEDIVSMTTQTHTGLIEEKTFDPIGYEDLRAKEINRTNTTTKNQKRRRAMQYISSSSEDEASELSSSGSSQTYDIHYSKKKQPDHDVSSKKALDGHELKDEATPPDGHMTVPLMKHQRIALAWMIVREIDDSNPRGGILADDQGMGKTITTISLILKNRPPKMLRPKLPTLIVCLAKVAP
ncbi:unnamed protein product [Calypogeia fissa]